MVRWSGVLIVIVSSALVGFAQRGGPAGAVRDPTATPPPPVVTNRLAGQVFDSQTNRPLRRALVQATTGNLQTARWTRTDAEGRWAFESVEPGAYTITASGEGFVTMAIGQKGAFGTPGTVRVPEDPRLDRLDITLPRGGVITGRIADDLGEPMARAGVQALRVKFVDGLRQLVPVASGISGLAYGGLTLTDDRGEFRLFGLAPGTYYVSAMYGPSAPGQSDDRLGYPETYYPGTSSIAQAQPLVVSASQPATASFSVTPTALSLVSGRVVTSPGQPVAARVTLSAVAPGHALQVGSLLARVADANGMFTIRGVPAGDYVLEVQGVELASSRVVVADRDIRELLVTTTRGGNAFGDFVIEGDPSGLSPNAFLVRPVPMAPGAISARGLMAGSGARGTGGRGTGGGFGTGALLGRHALRLARAPDGWFLKSVIVEGKDVTDAGFEVASGQTIEGIRVVVTQRLASLTGAVSGANGSRVSDYSVVAFAPDETRWGPHTRFVVSGNSREDGTFSLRGLPTGEYVVVAVAPLEAGEEMDPERLARWRSTGQRVTIADGDARSIALSLQR